MQKYLCMSKKSSTFASFFAAPLSHTRYTRGRNDKNEPNLTTEIN